MNQGSNLREWLSRIAPLRSKAKHRAPVNTSADPFEAMSDRPLPLYVPESDPRVDSIAEHVDSTPGMRGVAR